MINHNMVVLDGLSFFKRLSAKKVSPQRLIWCNVLQKNLNNKLEGRYHALWTVFHDMNSAVLKQMRT